MTVLQPAKILDPTVVIDVVENPNQVDRAEACPECGERHVDALVWQPGGDAVRCATCGAVYVPGGAA
jgi:LSD1 subclass zinc finger protein